MAIETPPVITPGPTPVIQRGDRVTFSSRIDAFVRWLIAGVPQFVAAGANVFHNAVEAFNSATAAATSATTASAAAVSTSADAVVATAKAAAATAAAVAADASAGMAAGIVAFSDVNPVVKNISDASKRMRFEVGGLPTATTAVLTVLKSGTVAMVDDAPGGGGAVAIGDVTLTATSGGAQLLTSTLPGQWVQLPDATTMGKGAAVFTIRAVGQYDRWVKDAGGNYIGVIEAGTTVVIGLADKSTVNGQWLVDGGIYGMEVFAEVTTTAGTPTGALTVALDATRTLVLSWGTGLYGVVHDSATHTFGVPILLRSGAFIAENVQAIKCAAGSALVVSAIASVQHFLVVAATGTTLSAGTPVSKGVAGGVLSAGDIILAGGTFVHAYNTGNSSEVIALTISGTAPTVGTALSVGTWGGSSDKVQIYEVSPTVVLFGHIRSGGTPDLTAKTLTISTGTTLTIGTSVGTITLDAAFAALIRPLSSGNFAVLYKGATYLYACILSISGTVTTFSSSTQVGVQPPTVTSVTAQVMGSQVVVTYCDTGSNSVYVIALTDSAGSVVVGTMVTVPTDALESFARPLGVFGTEAWIAPKASGGSIAQLLRVSIVSNNPVVTTIRSATYQSLFIPASGMDLRKAETGPGLMHSNTYAIGSVATGTEASVFAKSSGIYSVLKTPSMFSTIGSYVMLARGATSMEAWEVSCVSNNNSKIQIKKGRIL